MVGFGEEEWKQGNRILEERDILLAAITNAGKKVGIIRDDIDELSGPDCLLLLDNMVDLIK